MDREIQQRLQWVRLYAEVGDAGLVCRRCGVSRPTLRKWWRRYQEQGEAGLVGLSRRPNTSPQSKVTSKIEILILDLRYDRNLGARRIQSELKRLNGILLSLATIHKVLTRHQVKPVRIYRQKKEFIRYERPTPGDRVQTDRGGEFFAMTVQKKLTDLGIKFRPNKPASPHLNGKVERSQKTDKMEFYATINIKSKEIEDLLAEWQHYYNWERPHCAHGGRSPMDRYFELSSAIPFSDEVHRQYLPSNERIQNANYKIDLDLARLKRSM